jgi:DNA-binding transcriptional ArsR family regulator
MDEEIQTFILANISNHPQDIVKFAMERFGKSRPGIIYHLDQLLEKGLIRKRGEKNKTIYTDEQKQTLYFEKECSLEDLVSSPDLKRYNLKVYHLMIKNFIPEDQIWSCEITKNKNLINVRLTSSDGVIDVAKTLEILKKIPANNLTTEFNAIKMQKIGSEIQFSKCETTSGIVVSWDLMPNETLSIGFVEHIDGKNLKINVEKYLLQADGAVKLKELLKDKNEVMFNFSGVESLSSKFIELEFISLISKFAHVQFYIVGLSDALKFFLQLELSKTALSKNVIWVKEKIK